MIICRSFMQESRVYAAGGCRRNGSVDHMTMQLATLSDTAVIGSGMIRPILTPLYFDFERFTDISYLIYGKREKKKNSLLADR
jgi:hypothetical protein